MNTFRSKREKMWRQFSGCVRFFISFGNLIYQRKKFLEKLFSTKKLSQMKVKAIDVTFLPCRKAYFFRVTSFFKEATTLKWKKISWSLHFLRHNLFFHTLYQRHSMMRSWDVESVTQLRPAQNNPVNINLGTFPRYAIHWKLLDGTFDWLLRKWSRFSRKTII